MDMILQLVIFTILMTLGFIFGRRAERKHYRSIIERESQLQHVLLTSAKTPPEQLTQAHLVMGSVVVASDYFKRFVAWLRSIFGGNMSAYDSLLDRARREAVLRMKAQAHSTGANIVCNVKFTTASIVKDSSNSAMVEVMAFGTAGYLPPSANSAQASESSASDHQA